jgi:hypothetical protein
MLYGKAMVVTDTGFYSELPDDCVCKISIGNEICELRQALERLVADPSACHAMAARAQRWAEATFTARNYAAQIEAMTRLVRSAEPIVAAASTLANYMQEWDASSELLLNDGIVQPLEIFEVRR